MEGVRAPARRSWSTSGPTLTTTGGSTLCSARWRTSPAPIEEPPPAAEPGPTDLFRSGCRPAGQSGRDDSSELPVGTSVPASPDVWSTTGGAVGDQTARESVGRSPQNGGAPMSTSSRSGPRPDRPGTDRGDRCGRGLARRCRGGLRSWDTAGGPLDVPGNYVCQPVEPAAGLPAGCRRVGDRVPRLDLGGAPRDR